MFNKAMLFGPLFFLFALILPGLYVFSSSTPVTIQEEQVVYNLPYPGILPDHPLYIFKAIRDRVLELTTRDDLKKAELYLLLSDKRAAMALALADKGKSKLAVSTYSKGEKYFLNIPGLIVSSKHQGVGAQSRFIEQLRMSNVKHHQVGEILLREMPQGQNDAINSTIQLNLQIKKALESL